MYDNSRAAVLDQPNVRISALLVRHVLNTAIFLGRGLSTLVSNPTAVFRHQVHVVCGAMPKHHLVGDIVEIHQQIGILIDAPEAVPFRIELERSIDSAKFLFTCRHRRQLAPSHCRRCCRPQRMVTCLYFAGAQRAIVNLQLVNNSVEGVRRGNFPGSRGRDFVEVSADLEQTVRSPGSKMANNVKVAGFLAIDVYRDPLARIKAGGYVRPLHKRDASARDTLSPLFIDHNPQTDISSRIQSEVVSAPLLDNGVPIPWICLRRDPRLEGNCGVNPGQMRRSGNASRESVALKTIAPNALDN